MKVGREVDEGDEIDDRGGCPRFDKVTKVCLRLDKVTWNVMKSGVSVSSILLESCLL